MRDTSRAPQGEERELLLALTDYRQRFSALAQGYDGSTRRAAELEQLMGEYSAFVTDEHNQGPLTALEREGPADFADLVADLRTQSARCAAIMEKYRALDLLDGRARSAGYFDNVESCIEQEFGAFELTSASKVLLVGSGSFPMTPLYLAERIGASVVGVDIDGEAVELGRRVVQRLGGGLEQNIRLEHVPVEALPFTGEATHVIFSSTVEAKYDLLDLLHSLTRDEVVVAMRFGDRLKSLFNFPMRQVDQRKWRLVDTIRRPEQVFDIALYVKA
jgi:histidine 2-aminobutanoyltransferase